MKFGDQLAEFAEQFTLRNPNTNTFEKGKEMTAPEIEKDVKTSLEIALRALESSSSHSFYCIVEGRPTAKPGACDACDAIAEIKARGDWIP